MKKIIIAIFVMLFAVSGADAQQGSRKSFRINDTLFVDFILPDSNSVIVVVGNMTITGTLSATVSNTDSLAHKSIQQIYVIMRDTANVAIRDSLVNHYKKADVRAVISDSINGIDSTKIVNGKLGIGDVNNLWTLINERLYKSATRDSVNAGLLAADSTRITDGKLGIGDVNNLWALINARALFTAMVDSFATKTVAADVGALIYDSTHFPLDTLELIKAQWEAYIQDHQTSGTSAAAISDSVQAHNGPVTVAYYPDFPNVSGKVLSADTSFNWVIQYGDTVYYSFESDNATLDSFLVTVIVPIPEDFKSFNADTALYVHYWTSGNSADSSYLEIDAYKYPYLAELDSSKLALNTTWGEIIVPGSSLETNSYAAGDALRIEFTIGGKLNHDARIERVIMKYVRK